jgi:hypothetical protein
VIDPRSAIINDGVREHRLMIGTPTLGTIRIEWHNAMAGLVIPCNFSSSSSTPIGFLVDDAQNLIATQAYEQNFKWLLLLEDDVVPPLDLFLKLQPYVEEEKYPIVSGLYHLKGFNPRREPLIYRGRGNGAFRDFEPGDKVMVDGVPTGCLLIHRKILEVLAETAETYSLGRETPIQIRRFFRTPREVHVDQGTGAYQRLIGTSDLYFCDQVIREKVLERAGWPELQAEPYPFLVDTGIACGHIDRLTGGIF